ncbi:rhox homeobox family member 2-like [Meriones unguiculatus]|uniref:rhox homeobox family member 2-like n=1 Tax=Meriones unguiculatus TaxID=10047 RepID=UPI00293E3E6F|nr:rhox homeobox family member 2-like [Meriones unguiculatus]
MDSSQGTNTLPAIEKRREEDIGQGEPAWGATAAEGKELKQFSGEGPSAASAAGLVDEGMDQEDSDSEGCQENEQEEEELVPKEAMEGKSEEPVPRQVPRLRLRHKFTQWQLEELERIFQTNSSLSVEARRQLARWMGVTEAIVKRWFEKRREKYRRYKRL